MWVLILLYLFIANVVTFVIFGIDKHKAIKHEWRIPEGSLMGFAALGGALGALLGMKFYRHKTRHAKFTVGVPLILVTHIFLLIMLYMYIPY